MARLIFLGTAIAKHGSHLVYIVAKGTIKCQSTITRLEKYGHINKQYLAI